MNRYILACSCGGMKERAAKAFKIAFPDDEMPEELVGKDNIRKLIAKYPAESNFAKQLAAIVKKSGRYAYFIEHDDEYNITALYDLMTGKRIN